MKIIVLGCGINGITTAYMLAKMGCKVTVLEKNPSSAMECSYANGGQLSFSHVEPWSSRSSIFNIAKSAIKPNSSVSIKDLRNKEFLKWAFEFISNSDPKKSGSISRQLFYLGSYSKIVLDHILNHENINFSYNKTGILHFYRRQKSFLKAQSQAQIQRKMGVNLEILSSEECVNFEPTLTKLFEQNCLAGGILYKDDASGDSFAFARSLEAICKNKLGVEFIYNCQVKNILTNHRKITGINSSLGVFQADFYVSTLGSYGNVLLKGVGVETNIYPIKGYSISIPVENGFLAPSKAVTDVENKIVYSRLGSTFRAAGTIEVCGLKLNKNQSNINFIKNAVRSTYSDFGNLANCQDWFGFRPHSPDCLPIVGLVKKYGNLLVNSGHGSLGWTNSFASAKIISDKILERSIDSRFNFLEDKIN